MRFVKIVHEVGEATVPESTARVLAAKGWKIVPDETEFVVQDPGEGPVTYRSFPTGVKFPRSHSEH
jgi:hypothetical protein